MQKKIIWLIRIALGIVFIYASIDKIFHPAAFAQDVYNYQILPDALINITALILPWLELFLGTCLIAGILMPGALLLANLLLIVFMAALIFNLSRGLNVHCGCFSTKATGIADKSEMIWTIVRDAVFLAGGLFSFLRLYSERKSNYGLSEQNPYDL